MRLKADLSIPAAAIRWKSRAVFPWPGAAIDFDFIRRRYWWSGAEKLEANFTTFNLNGSTFSSKGLRPADGTIDVTLAMAGLGSLIPGSMGVAYENIANAGAGPMVQMDNGTEQERVSAFKTGSGTSQISIVDNNVTQANPAVGIGTLGVRIGFSFSYNTNAFLLSQNGVAGTADVSGTLPTPTTIRVGRTTTGVFANSVWIARVVIFTADKPQGALDLLSAALRDAV